MAIKNVQQDENGSEIIIEGVIYKEVSHTDVEIGDIMQEMELPPFIETLSDLTSRGFYEITGIDSDGGVDFFDDAGEENGIFAGGLIDRTFYRKA